MNGEREKPTLGAVVSSVSPMFFASRFMLFVLHLVVDPIFTELGSLPLTEMGRRFSLRPPIILESVVDGRGGVRKTAEAYRIHALYFNINPRHPEGTGSDPTFLGFS